MSIGRPIKHKLSDIDYKKCVATCVVCGPVRIYKDRYGHKKTWVCSRHAPDRKLGKPLTHKLSAVDPATRTGTCEKCGLVNVYWRRRGRSADGETGRWVCIQRPVDLRKINNIMSHHKLTDVDEQRRIAHCAKCGLVPIRRAGRRKRGTYWLCTRKSNQSTTAWRRGEGQKLIDAQSGKCAICGGLHRTLCLDHDHKTGKNRGGLCHACNLGLGYFKDDPARLRAAAAYIETHLKTHLKANHDSGID